LISMLVQEVLESRAKGFVCEKSSGLTLATLQSLAAKTFKTHEVEESHGFSIKKKSGTSARIKVVEVVDDEEYTSSFSIKKNAGNSARIAVEAYEPVADLEDATNTNLTNTTATSTSGGSSGGATSFAAGGESNIELHPIRHFEQAHVSSTDADANENEDEVKQIVGNRGSTLPPGPKQAASTVASTRNNLLATSASNAWYSQQFDVVDNDATWVRGL